MGKSKTFIKEETIRRIIVLLGKYSVKELKRSIKEDSIWKYMNEYEKSHVNSLIDLCNSRKTYDEIRFIIQGGNDQMSATKKNNSIKKKAEAVEMDEMDPVEEAMFMVSQQRVVEAEPVDVKIGDEDSNESIPKVEAKVVETMNIQNEAVEEIVDVEYEVVDEEPKLLSDMVKNKKESSKAETKDKTESVEMTADEEQDLSDEVNKNGNDFMKIVNKAFDRIQSKTWNDYLEQAKREIAQENQDHKDRVKKLQDHVDKTIEEAMKSA